jgi:hypothetical protein
MQPDSNAAPTAATIPFETPDSPAKPSRRGRPRTLDDARRREICAFVSTGLSVREAARCVKCGFNTVLREAQRNPEFQEQLRRAEVNAKLGPLHAMQKAAYTHWRAGAWFLERMFPERFGRRDRGGLGPRQAKQLLKEIFSLISSEVADGARRTRMENRIQAMLEYFMHVACDGERTSSGCRETMKYFDEKNKVHDPLAFLGIVEPDLDALFDAYPRPGARYTAPSPAPPAAQPPAPTTSSTVAPEAPSTPPTPPTAQPPVMQPKAPLTSPPPRSPVAPPAAPANSSAVPPKAPSTPPRPRPLRSSVPHTQSPMRKHPFNGLKPSIVHLLAGGLSDVLERRTNTPSPPKPGPSAQQPPPAIQSPQPQTPASPSLADQPPPSTPTPSRSDSNSKRASVPRTEG